MTSSSQDRASDQVPEAEKAPTHYEGIAPQRYEVTWLSGHIETVIAHQVSWPGNLPRLFGGAHDRAQRIQFHAEVGGRWTLQLSALEDDIRTVRNITNGEAITPGGAA